MDNKLLKGREFKKVVQGLWNKVKDNYVHNTESNYVQGKTVLKDSYVEGTFKIVYDNKSTQMAQAGLTACFSSKNLLISANTLISKITLIVDSSLNVDDIVTNVKVGAISVATDTVLDYVIDDQTATVHENVETLLTGTRAITVNINKTWDEDVYLLVGANKMLWYSRPDSDRQIFAWGTDDKPAVGRVVGSSWSQEGTFVGRVIAYGKEIPLKSLIKEVNHTGSGQITIVKADGTNKVIDIMNQPSPIGQIMTTVYELPESPIAYAREKEPIEGQISEINNRLWLKCEGQTLLNQNGGQDITLPKSTDLDYKYVCIGKVVTNEDGTKNVQLGL